MMYKQKTLVTRVSEVVGRFCTRTDITALNSGVASRLVARATGTSGHNRLTPRGYRSPGTSPLSPVVRHAGGVTTPIYKEGLLFGLAREKQKIVATTRAAVRGGNISGVSRLNRH